MSGLLIYGIIASLLCIAGVIFAVINVHRLIDLSRVHPRTNCEKSIDDDGLLTQLTPDQRRSVVEENERLVHSHVKEARLRTDLPPVPVTEIEKEWVEELHAGQDWRTNSSVSDAPKTEARNV